MLQLAEDVFRKDGKLDKLESIFARFRRSRRMLQQAIDTAVPATVITASLSQRFRTWQDNSFPNRLLAALRNELGGHALEKKGG